jgi:hypothetical protein
VTPETALIALLRDVLKANSAIAALVGHKVYDEIPDDNSADAKAPYIYVGPVNTLPAVTNCDDLYTLRIRLYAVSTKWSRTELWALIHAIRKALNRQTDRSLVALNAAFVLAAPFVLQDQILAGQAGDVIDPEAPKSAFIDMTTSIAEAS